MSEFTDEQVFALLGTQPARREAPESPEATAALLGGAFRAGHAVVPWGGGLAQDFGYAPRRADLIIETRGLNRILALEAGDMTISVQSGVTLSKIQQALGEHGLFLPIDPEQPQEATIGGILATNAFGAARTGYGVARDWLIGMTVADGQGEIVKGGGNVVKNVTGYDLPKLHIGALGTLGVIVSANFKVAPLPEISESLVFALPESRVQPGFLSAVREKTSPVVAALRYRNGSHLCLLVFAGFREPVAEDMEKVTQLGAEHGTGQPAQATAEAASAFLAPPEPESYVMRVRIASCMPTRAEELHHAVCGVPGVLEVRSHPFYGQTDAFVAERTDLQDVHGALADISNKFGSTLCVLRAPLALRNGKLALWAPIPPSFPLMRRLKAALDPAGIINAGRFIAEL